MFFGCCRNRCDRGFDRDRDDFCRCDRGFDIFDRGFDRDCRRRRCCRNWFF
jgi:hypothetical protein